MVGEGPLGLEADAPVLEIGIEAFLRFPVAIDKTLCLVLVDVERPCLALPLEIPSFTGLFRRRLQTRLTSLSPDMPGLYSAKRFGCSLMKLMTL